MESEFELRNKIFTEEDKEYDKNIRPKRFREFNGQEKLIENLKVFVEAAKLRKEALDHVILSGPPGLGKTTLANIISNELNSNIKITSGPILEKAGDLAGILTGLEKNDVLFIDEIHRLSISVEEFLYAAMEDYKIDLIIDKGPSARSIQLYINPFTLIGATTRAGLLSSPLRARFGINMHLDYYDNPVMERIVKRSANLLNIAIHEDAAKEIASRSRGTPRVANSLLRRVRDFAQVKKLKSIDIEITEFALEALNIDKNGLDTMDNKILRVIIDKFNGGPVGLNTIASAISEDPGTIEEVYEPFLLKEGYIKRTPRGREATSASYEHFGRIRNNELNLRFD
jgi:holliday junction DNA helicase RuvB